MFFFWGIDSAILPFGERYRVSYPCPAILCISASPPPGLLWWCGLRQFIGVQRSSVGLCFAAELRQHLAPGFSLGWEAKTR
jgi:hypothetical protein